MKKEAKYALPDMEFPFHLEIAGEESKINWVGDFMYRRPNLGERARIEALKVKLNQDLITLPEDTKAFNEAIAYLRFTLKEYPEWWAESDFGSTLYDANVVLYLFQKAMEFEADWIKKVHGGKKEDVKVGANEEAEATVGTAP